MTDRRAIARAIAVATHARLVRPSPAYAARELAGRRDAAEYRLRHSGQTVFLRHNTSDASILHEVFGSSIYEPPASVEASLRALARPLRIADLGANIGLFDLFALERWPCESLVCFEPHPGNVKVLRQTVAANPRAGDWRVIEACAFTTHGRLAFGRDHFSDSRVVEAVLADGEGATGQELVAAVDAFPLLADADLLKVDIEGGEWALLADARFPTLPARAVAIEYHPHLAPGPDAREHASAALRRAGYQVLDVFHDPRGHGMLWGWRDSGGEQ